MMISANIGFIAIGAIITLVIIYAITEAVKLVLDERNPTTDSEDD